MPYHESRQDDPFPPGREPLLILGASSRAAAQSAARAGFAPRAIDLFADADLAALCPVVQIDDFPAGFEAAARSFLAGPWIYAGGLENYPALVDKLAAERPLLGNPGGVLREVRDPLEVAATFREAGLPHPQAALAPLARVRCLRKPRNSCGGGRLAFAIEREAAGPQPAVSGSWYFQEFVPGISTSAIYVGAAGRAVLLGVTRQLVGEPWTAAGRFQYCGSLGPLDLPPDRHAQYERIGCCLAERFELRGLFGVDAIENEAGIWSVEVNPRYTASVEILERGMAMDAIALHVSACRHGALPVVAPAPRKGCHGKAVLFARKDITIGAEFFEYAHRTNNGNTWPVVADIPRAGTTIQAGQPVVSIFACGMSPSEAEQRLRELSNEFPLQSHSIGLATSRISNRKPSTNTGTEKRNP